MQRRKPYWIQSGCLTPRPMWRAWRCPTGPENSRGRRSASAMPKSTSTLHIQVWNPGRMSRFFSSAWQRPAAPPQSWTKRLQPPRAVEPQPSREPSQEAAFCGLSVLRAAAGPHWSLQPGPCELTGPAARRSVILTGLHGPVRRNCEDETRRTARGAGYHRAHQWLDPELRELADAGARGWLDRRNNWRRVRGGGGLGGGEGSDAIGSAAQNGLPSK